jgi:hypothetical protein
LVLNYFLLIKNYLLINSWWIMCSNGHSFWKGSWKKSTELKNKIKWKSIPIHQFTYKLSWWWKSNRKYLFSHNVFTDEVYTKPRIQDRTWLGLWE